MTESLEIRLARMEEKLDFLVDKVGDMSDMDRSLCVRVGALEKDSVRTKTLFGVLGAMWTLIAGMIGAWIRSAFGR